MLGGIIGPSSSINIGSEMSGDVYNILIRKVAFKGSLFSSRIKTGRGRGGKVFNVTFEDFVMEENAMGPCISMYYADNEPKPPLDITTPHIFDIIYRRHSGTTLVAGTLLCLPESPCRGIVFEDVNMSSVVGLQCIHAFGMNIGNVVPDSCLKEK